MDEAGEASASIEERLGLIWTNIQRILAEAHMTTANIVRLTSYLHDASYAEANAQAPAAALGDRRIPTTAIIVQTPSPDWHVEIEIIAAG